MTIEPRPHVIVVKKTEPPKESPGGIVLPDNVQMPNADKLAVVTHVGEDVKCVSVGDSVIFSRQFVDVVVIGKETYAFCTEKHILAILK